MENSTKTCEACGADRPGDRCGVCYTYRPELFAGRAYAHALDYLRKTAKRGSALVSRRSKFYRMAQALCDAKCLRFETYNGTFTTYTVTAYGFAVLASAPSKKLEKAA